MAKENAKRKLIKVCGDCQTRQKDPYRAFCEMCGSCYLQEEAE